MTNIEAIFFWMAVWVYGISFLIFLYGFVFKKEGGISAGLYLTIAGFCFQTMSMVLRWATTGHPPVMGTYENSMLLGWFIVVLFMAIGNWYGRIGVIGVIILPIVIMTIGNGVMSDTTHMPLSPPYKSNWLWFHIFFGWMAFGAFFIAFGLGVIYLLKEKAEVRGNAVEFYMKLPNLGVLNDVMMRTVIFGFIALTVEIGAGAIWAYGLWGRYWGWDPVETWSLIVWLTYGTYIHLGVTLGWRGRRMAWLAVFAIIFVFITLGGIGFIGGIHTPLL